MKVQGPQSSSHRLCSCLNAYGVTDADIYWQTSSQPGHWECWIPLLNLHQLEQMQQSLSELGALDSETGWSWVTMVGRSLLGLNSNEIDAEKFSKNPSQEESTLLNQVSRLCDDNNLQASVLSFTPSAIRWAIPIEQASKLVEVLHSQFLNIPK